MAALSEVVVVNIAVADATVSQANFNKILFAAYHTVGTERKRDYTSLLALQTDFAAWPAVLAAGAAFFAQNPNPGTLSIGRLLTAYTKTFTQVPTVQNLTLYRTVVNGINADFTSDGTATLAEICTGIAAAINALAISGVTSTGASGTTVVTTGTSGTWFSLRTMTPLVTVTELTASPANLAVELGGILTEVNDTYGLVYENQSDACITTVASFATSNGKVYSASSSTPAIPTSATNDLASNLVALGYDHVFLVWTQTPCTFPELRIMAEEFPWNPGSRTWAFKKAVGAESVDAYLTATGLTSLKAKNVNRFASFGGNVVFFDGKMIGGRFIDITLGVDWLTARMTERLVGVQINATDKNPYTDQSLFGFQNAMDAQLQEAVRNKVLADDEQLYTTILPVASQNPNDRAARIVRGLYFHGRLAGAVHTLFVSGTVTV